MPTVENCSAPPTEAERPVTDEPTCRLGVLVDPLGTCRALVKVPPVSGKLRLASPVKLAVMVPAEKFPLALRSTIAFAAFADVAVVALFATRPAVVNVTRFALVIVVLAILAPVIVADAMSEPVT